MDSFLLIGQSNMAGRGSLEDAPVPGDPRILMFRDGAWLPAVEPLHTDKPVAGSGLGMSFAVDVLARYPGRTVGLIPAAVGGTPLSRWVPGADLYAAAVATAHRALSHGPLRGILWHQGEGDSGDAANAESYGTRFAAMVRGLRSEFDADSVPVISGELGRFLANRETPSHFETVNRQLHGQEGVLPLYACVSSEGLHDKGDSLHFDTPSLRAFGRRYASAFLHLAGQDAPA